MRSGRGGFGCKTPSSMFNMVESLQMTGVGGVRGAGEEEGEERERVGSCSRVKGLPW